MKKIAWPWVGSTEHEMGSMSKSFEGTDQSSKPYETLVPEKSSTESQAPATNYSGGIISPVKMEPEQASESLVNYLEDGDSILDVGCGDGKHAAFLSGLGFNVVGIDLSRSNLQLAPSKFTKVNGDVRYYNFDKKFDAFQALSSLEYMNDYELALQNIYSHLRPRAVGLIHSQNDLIDPDKLKKAIKNTGFDIKSNKKLTIKFGNQPKEYTEFIVQKNDLDKLACVEIVQSGKVLSYFICDIASSLPEKIAGLQSYSKLQETAGLLFPYEKPSDVIYHMGSVSYPIDILFVDEDHTIKKICKNIKPGTLGTYGCSNVTYVLEICGGLSDLLNIQEGQSITISKGSLSENINKLNKYAASKNYLIYKYSKDQQSGFSMWNHYPVFTAGGVQGIIKVSALATSPTKNVNAFYIDPVLENCLIKAFSKKDFNEDHFLLDVFNNPVTINKTASENISLSQHIKDPVDKVILKSQSSLDSLTQNPELLPLFRELKLSQHSDSKTVLISKFSSHKEFEAIISSAFEIATGEKFNAELLACASNDDHLNLMNILDNKYPASEIKIFAHDSLLKQAGVPISDDVKNQAKKVYKILEKAEVLINQSLENIQKNLAEYQKITSPEIISQTKGQYKQSVKRNTDLAKSFLTKIRDAVKLLNDIKDASTTIEVIEGLANSAQSASEVLEDIFNIIEIIEEPSFIEELNEKTGLYEEAIDDLLSNVDIAKEYINSNILGLIVLTN